MSDGSVAVLADAQFSLARILKPFDNFEAVYQGQELTRPIAFPGTLDEDAGKPGFAPNLIAGISMPLGCRVMIWIPQTIFGYTSPTRYTYQVCWRLRSPADYTNDVTRGRSFGAQSTYSLPQQEVGVPGDLALPEATKRFVLPAAMQSIAYEQAEPATALTNGLVNLRGQLLTTNGALWQAPITPSGAQGQLTQGIFPDVPSVDDAGGGPVFFPFWFDSEGNEMFILAQRETVTAAEWDFTADDRAFSNTYGTNNGTRAPLATVGIYVFTGSAP